jgi:hypothetical protein
VLHQRREAVEESREIDERVRRGAEESDERPRDDDKSGEDAHPPLGDEARDDARHENRQRAVVLGGGRQADSQSGQEELSHPVVLGGPEREEQRERDEERERRVGQREVRFAHVLRLNRHRERREERCGRTPSESEPENDVDRERADERGHHARPEIEIALPHLIERRPLAVHRAIEEADARYGAMEIDRQSGVVPEVRVKVARLHDVDRVLHDRRLVDVHRVGQAGAGGPEPDRGAKDENAEERQLAIARDGKRHLAGTGSQGDRLAHVCSAGLTGQVSPC